MDPDTADELIDTYFECLDSLDYDRLGSIYTQDIELGWLDGKVITGWDDVREFYRVERGDSDTDHHILQRVYDGSLVATEGEVIYNRATGKAINEFCDIFEFDDGLISRVSIYTRS